MHAAADQRSPEEPIPNRGVRSKRLRVLIMTLLGLILSFGGVVLYRWATAPWHVLQHARVTRVQTFDDQGRPALDTGDQPTPANAAALAQVSDMLATAHPYASQVLPRYAPSSTAMTPGTDDVIVEFESNGSSYRMRVDHASTCRLQMTAHPRVSQFLTPRNKHLHDRIASAAASTGPIHRDHP